MSRKKKLGGVLTGAALREMARKRLAESEAPAKPARRRGAPIFPTSYSAKPIVDEASRDEEGLLEVEHGGESSFAWGTREKQVRERVLVVVPYEEEDGGEEIRLLCSTLELETADTVVLAKLRKPDPATYIGSGVLEKIGERMKAFEATAVVFDVDITPAQMRNLEDALQAPVLDREGVILAIFRLHARSKLAKLQVELAHLKYMQPRLAGQWMGLSRQRGRAGGLGGRGIGETRLELDRRVVKDRIAGVARRLKEAERTLGVQSARRSRLPRVALVGYTNAGKSTLMRRLTGSDALVENKLFSTLDTTVRPLVPPTEPQILVSDTVGFVRKLPHDLVASFKSTLREATESRLILHVLDASRHDWREQLATTEEVLSEVGCDGIPRLLVLNKTDLLDLPVRLRAGQVNRHVADIEGYDKVIPVSALRGEGLSELRAAILASTEAMEPAWRRKEIITDEGTEA